MAILSRHAVIALAAVAAMGCTVSFDPGNTQFACTGGPGSGAADTCPSGSTCLSGLCVAGDGGAQPDQFVPPPCEPTAHLVLSEVFLQPEPLEFIEIANPTGNAIDLTNVYLSDTARYPMLPDYATGTASGITSSDFIIQFPLGQAIGAGDTLIVATNGTEFFNQFGVQADLTLNDMIRVEPASGTPSLNNAGESIVLFQWDGQTDLITDIDALAFGTGSGDDALANKTGLMVDGPDVDTVPSTYANDSHTAPSINPSQPGQSMQRIQGEGGRETTAGNGIEGDDETSEPLDATWFSGEANPGELSFCIP